MAYKQNFKSPILKALVGKQHNLPQHLQDAIKAAPESPAKQTTDPPKMRKKQFEDARGEAKKLPKRKRTAKMKDLSGDGKVTKKDVLIGRGVLKKDGSPAKKGKPKKGDKYKGGRNVTDAAMADRKRRVDEGMPVRRKDYAPGKDGQAAFNTDRRASYDNRIAKSKSIRKRLQSGEITKKEAQAERNAYAKKRQKNASNKRTSADGNWDGKNSKAQTFVISRKGIKRKVSDAEKASYNSVAKKR